MRLYATTLIAVALCATLIAPLNAQTQKSAADQMVEATERVYNEAIQEDPTNYNAYFRRAHLYYGQNKYLRALSDIDNGLRYTPSSDTDMLSQEYVLRANIYLMLDRPADALPDITKALEYDPSSYTILYQKANLEYELGNYKEAKEDYQRMSRLHNRSLESLIGLARVAVKENNLGLANEYADQAVNLYPSESEAYLRRASVRQLMGNNTGAVDDMLLAIATGNNNSKAIRAIVDMANNDYNAVISGLSNAVNQAPDSGIYYYIRAMIAQAHYRYIAAIADYNTIIDRGLYNYHGINASLAECYFALCNDVDALKQINVALGASHNNASYLVTSSKIHLAMGNIANALQYADRALELNPNNDAALTQSGLANIANDNYAEASTRFGELIINQPEDPANYIIKAWIIAEKQEQRADATTFLTRCADLQYPDTDIRSLRGFALQLMGQTDAANLWLEGVLNSNPKDIDGYIHYLAACLYAHLGNTDKAFEAMQSSLEHGYANLYNWRYYSIANLNVAPLRNDPRFEQLLAAYSHLF